MAQQAIKTNEALDADLDTSALKDPGPNAENWGSLCSKVAANAADAETRLVALELRDLFSYAADSNNASHTGAAADISGGDVEAVLNLTGALGAGADFTLPTVAALVAAIPGVVAGRSYKLRLINSSSGNFAWTVLTNTGWTLAGTMTVAQNTWREFIVTFTSLSAATLQSVGTGTNS